MAQKAEEAAASGNMKQLYDITRKLSGKSGRIERPVKDKNRNFLKGADKQLSRWPEHFEELLNRPAPAYTQIICLFCHLLTGNFVRWPGFLKTFLIDLALLSHKHQQMQEKTSGLQRTSVQVGQTLNKQKTKILRINAGTDEPVKIEGEELGEVESFTYLGSVMDKRPYFTMDFTFFFNGQKWGNRRRSLQ